MTLRIGLIGTQDDPLRREGPAAELHALLPAGAAFRAYPSRVPVFPFTALEQAMQQVGYLDAALRAEDDSCDALVIDSTGDYGLPAIRAAVGVPIAGAGEAGVAAAAAHGRFAIVTVWPSSMNFIPAGLLRALGQEAACVGIYNVGAEPDLATLGGPDGYLARVRGAAHDVRDAIERAIDGAGAAGARAVLLGCTCMSPLAAGIAARAGIAVINPLASAVTAALAAAPLTRAARIRPGRRELVARMAGAVAGSVAEDCPVCIATDTAG
jgi:allantoin racemase